MILLDGADRVEYRRIGSCNVDGHVTDVVDTVHTVVDSNQHHALVLPQSSQQGYAHWPCDVDRYTVVEVTMTLAGHSEVSQRSCQSTP